MGKANSARRLRGADLHVNPENRPGWVSGKGRAPSVGESVYCVAGEGTVASLHGKTGDGSRLIQIRLEEEGAPPFFAAASNVLVTPVAGEQPPARPPRAKHGPAPAL